MRLPLHEGLQPNSILRQLFEYKISIKIFLFSDLRLVPAAFVLFVPHTGGTPAQAACSGCSCSSLPALEPLANLMLAWWLLYWHVPGEPECSSRCCSDGEKSILPFPGQNMGERPATSPLTSLRCTARAGAS